MLDIFNNDAFSVVSLTDAINEIAIRPNRMTEMGIFEETPVTTTVIAQESIGDTIQLVAPSPRGGKGDVRDFDKRAIKNFTVPHFMREWSVMADEVQNIRAYGTESELETVMGIVARRLKVHMQDLDVTGEYARLGAVQGIVTYKGGETLNLFDEFGIAQPTEVDFELDAAAPASGALLGKCDDIIKATRQALGGVPFSHVHALCGGTFFRQVLAHKDVRETYLNWGDARILRESMLGDNRSSNKMFEFGGIVFENYDALATSGDGTALGIPLTKAKFFPVGVQGLFRTYYAPAPYQETVNTLGKKFYAKQEPMQFNKGVMGEVQTNALNLCTRPAVLMRAKNT